MRLLLISTENVDQAMVIVPDDYDKKEVLAQAAKMLDGDVYIECDAEIDDQAKYGFSEYRIYVG